MQNFICTCKAICAYGNYYLHILSTALYIYLKVMDYMQCHNSIHHTQKSMGVSTAVLLNSD